jgi:hypothetical protein
MDFALVWDLGRFHQLRSFDELAIWELELESLELMDWRSFETEYIFGRVAAKALLVFGAPLGR